MTDLHNRRMFLRAAASAGAAWAASDLLRVEEALAWTAQHAGQHAAGGKAASGASTGFAVLSKDQAETLDAMMSRILPAVDGRPGAHEAGAVLFIDRSLATFNAGQKALYVEGVQDLNRRAAAKPAGAPPAARGASAGGAAAATGASGFAGLAAAQQDEVLREIEKTPFFQSVRFDTIVGTFALPSWGGNRDFAGWHMIGLDHQPAFQPPFGYYDTDANRRS